MLIEDGNEIMYMIMLYCGLSILSYLFLYPACGMIGGQIFLGLSSVHLSAMINVPCNFGARIHKMSSVKS